MIEIFVHMLGAFTNSALDASKPQPSRNSAFERNKAYTPFGFVTN